MSLSLGNALLGTTGLSTGLGLSVGNGLAFSGFGAFSPASLFTGGVQGVWYDPSNFATLFQDSAGTTPVTAVEQPVGRMLDLSGNNNHATQSTSAARPVLSARVNLLTKTEQFNDAAWVKANSGSTNPTVTTGISDPIGGTTANRISFGAVSSAGSYSNVYQQLTPAAAGTYKVSFYIKASSVSDIGKTFYINFGTSSVYTGFTLTDSWQQISQNFIGATSLSAVAFGSVGSVYDGSNQTAFSADVWGADVRAASDGVGLPVYQRVNTATDYDTTGFPIYLRFDGSDDFLRSTFTISQPITRISGLRVRSITASQLLGGVSANAGALYFPTGTTLGIFSGAGLSGPTVSVPGTYVTKEIHNGASSSLSANNSATSSGNAGTTLPGGITLGGPSSGNVSPVNLYSLVEIGRLLTASEIAQTEAWVNGKTRAY